MAPASESGTPPSQLLSLWDLIDGLFKHPGLLFGASTIILGIFATQRIKHSTRRRHEQWNPLTLRTISTDEKHAYNHLSLSDLPPPLRSVLTSATLAEGLSPSQQRLISSDPLPYQRQYIPSNSASSAITPSRSSRRHSYPSSLDRDSAVTEIKSDKTTYYPIIDDEGNRQPGRWRRRTLVFEMLPATDHSHDMAIHDPETQHDVSNGLKAEIDLKRDGDETDHASDRSKKARNGIDDLNSENADC